MDSVHVQGHLTPGKGHGEETSKDVPPFWRNVNILPVSDLHESICPFKEKSTGLVVLWNTNMSPLTNQDAPSYVLTRQTK